MVAAALAGVPSVAQVSGAVLSDAEKLDRAESALDTMRRVLKEVLKILEDARQEKDVLKLQCVNDKLTQIKGLLKVSEQADVDLREAVAKREIGQIDHASTKISIAKERIEQLRVEAEQCIGQLAYVIDEKTMVEIVSPEGLPQEDPTVVEPLPPPVIRPPPASPEKP